MSNSFKKLMRIQVQDTLDKFQDLTNIAVPKKGWLKTIREALGITSKTLAQKLGFSATNLLAIEKREENKTVTLATLEQAAQAMNCKLVYCIVPIKHLDQILEDQARKVAKKQIKTINYSMTLEKQGLSPKQLKQQENDLIQELLRGNLKNLWDNK